MIEISHLTKKYGTHVAVDDLNLTIEPGRIYGFLGPNGAGKSTTMNMITGYLGATEGTIKINGFDILAQPEEAKKCIGYLPELPPLYMDMTVEEYRSNQGTAILHFYEKLLKLKDLMNTDYAKQLAIGRHHFLEEYLEQFYAEWNAKK